MSLMPAAGTRLSRRCTSLVGVFAVAASLIVTCGGSERFELTLRTRDYNGGRTSSLDRQWRTADGRHAVSLDVPGLFLSDGKAEVGDVECGGQSWPRHSFSVLNPAHTRDDSFELAVDDGNHLTLDPQTAVMVTSTETNCFEETGRWRGTAGHVRNHEGTFTMHYDSIQTVLRIVEG